MMTALFSQSYGFKQRGVATVAVAALLVFILVAAVTSVMNLSGSAAVDAARNEQQVAALFLAESGLERAHKLLISAADPSLPTACTGSGVGSLNYGRGSISTTGTPSPTGCSGSGTPCTQCVISSTGSISSGGVARTISQVFSVSAPSGGAIGCGGAGGASVNAANCPGVSSADLHTDVTQSIDVLTGETPAVLLSNLAYLRHPVGGATVDAAGCVTIPASGVCVTAWNSESSHSNGDVVVGSRGAVDTVSVPASYTFKQNLSADSFYAAVGVKIGKAATASSLSLVGSYWDDSGNSGSSTHANSQTQNGATNNGTLCATPGVPDTTSCPLTTVPPSSIPLAGTQQASRSWCYGADTMIFGFSGRSSNNNNGKITGLTFGNSPAATQVPNGFAEFPKPNAATSTESAIYSSMWYLHNPGYDSPSNANTRSGALLTGRAGSSFSVNLTKNQFYLEVVGSVTGDALVSGVDVTVSSETFTTTTNTGCKTTSALTTNCATPGGAGFYGISNKPNANATGAAATATSNTLTITAASLPYLADGDTVFASGVTTGLTASFASGASPGGIGVYTLSGKTYIAQTANNITSNGVTVTTSAPVATPPQVPVSGSYLALRWTGQPGQLAGSAPFILASTPVSANDGVTATVTFNLAARPVVPLNGASLCGGICAFFNHSSQSATTTFTATNSDTQQWSAGLTCLAGVDPATIQGLIGNASTVKVNGWYEAVR